MPGKKPTKPKPSEYLVTAGPQATLSFGAGAGTRRRIESFPLVDGEASPAWVDLPRRRIVTELGMLPQGAHPMPLFDPTGPAEMKPIHPAEAAQARLLMVGEGYPDDGGDEFFADCHVFSRGLLGTPPFDQVAGLIAIDGLFLPLRGSAVVNIGCSRTSQNLSRLRPTLFGTQCCLDGRTPHLWGGDEDRVRKLVDSPLRANGRRLENYLCLAVLIRSNEYGGAGSVAADGPAPLIAWATTGHAQSLRILVHELGHALGLQDEYERPQAEPPKPWRNISDFEEPRATPWSALATERNDRLTWPSGPEWTGPKSAVGTFEGAGYKSTRRYRPSPDCCMRTLESPFCPVCSDFIRDRLDPNHAGHVGGEN